MKKKQSTPPPRRNRVAMYLNDEELEWLQKTVRTMGLDESVFMRVLLNKEMHKSI